MVLRKSAVCRHRNLINLSTNSVAAEEQLGQTAPATLPPVRFGPLLSPQRRPVEPFFASEEQFLLKATETGAFWQRLAKQWR